MDQIEVQVILPRDNWMTPSIFYLKDGQLPDDQGSTRKLKVWASHFVLIKDILYKKGFSLLYLRCLAPSEANYVLREVYEGIYGNHAGAHSLTRKLIRARYYWPTLQKDAQSYIRACDKCQRLVASLDNHQSNSPQ